MCEGCAATEQFRMRNSSASAAVPAEPIDSRHQPCSRASATRSRPATRLPLTSTASSGPSGAERGQGGVTSTAWSACRRRRRRRRPHGSRARRPASRSAAWSSSLVSPSSAITPSTAVRRFAGSAASDSQRRRHRRRVGVVGVVQDAAPRCGAVDELHAPRRQRGVAQAGRDLVDRQPARERRGRRAQRVVHLVDARARQLPRRPSPTATPAGSAAAGPLVDHDRPRPAPRRPAP